MFVQLVSLPGAGKTTLAARLEESNPARFERVEVAYRPFFSLLRALPLDTLASFARVAPFVAHSLVGRASLVDLNSRLQPISTLVNLLVIYRRADCATGAKLHVLDEFVCQRALGLFGYSREAPSRRVLDVYFGLLRPFAALPVFVHVAPEEALMRAQSRSAGLPERMRGLTASQVRSLYHRQSDLMHAFAEIYPRAMHVDAGGEIEDAVRALRSQLEAL